MGKNRQDSIFVTVDVVGLYPIIPHNAGLDALQDALDYRQNKKIPTDMLVKMAEFVLANNYFEFGQKVFHQISGTAIGTKFAPSYAWFRYKDDVFFIWTHGKEELENFMKELNCFSDHIKFTLKFT